MIRLCVVSVCVALTATLAGCSMTEHPATSANASESQQVTSRVTLTATPHIEACDAKLRCHPVSAAPTVVTLTPLPEPFAPRDIPFSPVELWNALDVVSWPVAERPDFMRIVLACENREMNAGAVNDVTPHGSYGAAQLWLGWFDYVGLSRERWYVLIDNVRAAKGARDYSVERGMRPFAQWECAYR